MTALRSYALGLLLFAASLSGGNIQLQPKNTDAGYLARLLINETPFPGEKGWVSITDSKATMSSILWVLNSRIRFVPPGYRQTELTTVKTSNIFDVITAGGVHGQCEGFYRDDSGELAAVPRVEQRVQYLCKIGGNGPPGKFASLINYAQQLANSYLSADISTRDLFVDLHLVSTVSVTGRAYGWMTDAHHYSPGGDFVRIPDSDRGALGGNRFFTLKKRAE